MTKKGTLLNPRLPRLVAQRGLPILSFFGLHLWPSLEVEGSKAHLRAGGLVLELSRKHLNSPCWPLVSWEKLLGGGEFPDPCGNPSKQRQGHQEPSSTLPHSPGPCQFSLSPYLQPVSGLFWVWTSSPWLQGNSRGMDSCPSPSPLPRDKNFWPGRCFPGALLASLAPTWPH